MEHTLELSWVEGNKEEQHPGMRKLRTGMLLCWADDELGPLAIGLELASVARCFGQGSSGARGPGRSQGKGGG